MKQNINRLIFTALAAVALLTTSCSKEPQDDGGSSATGKMVSVTLPIDIADTDVANRAADLTTSRAATATSTEDGFTVSFGEQVPQEAATAKATATRIATKAPATRTIAQELSNVWVLQFNSSGANVSTTKSGTLTADTHLTLPSLEVGTGYTIYVVANGVASGLSKSNPSTLADFESKMLHTTAVTDATKLPMAGKLTGVSVIDLGDGKGKLKLMDEAPLTLMVKRIHAELTLTVDFGVTGYTLTNAQLYNVPKGATYGWGSATTTFPANTVATNFGYTNAAAAGMASLTPTTNGTKTTYKWFVGDNRRGEVAGLTAQTDRNSTKAPAYATFARVTINNVGTIMYDIYLGSGSVTNFDIKRNMTYTATAAIKGTADSQEALTDTDARVSGTGFPIYLTDSKADSPIVISPKSTETTTRIWGPDISIPGAQDIFNGKANTDLLMTTNATAYLAAKRCRDLDATYYLPSQAELMLIWIYQSAIPAADLPGADSFWSSTELSIKNSTAWLVDLWQGTMRSSNKSSKLSVRCVREF